MDLPCYQIGYYEYDLTPRLIIDVKQWGDIKWTSLTAMFYDAVNLEDISASDAPDLSNMPEEKRQLYMLFFGATSFNGDISHWDFSMVSDTGAMPGSARSFNQDIGRWDVSRATNMWQMFYDTPVLIRT